MEKAAAITYGKPSEQKTLKIPGVYRLKCVFIYARICFLVFPRYNNAFLWIASLCWKLSEKLQTRMSSLTIHQISKTKAETILNAITGTLYVVRRVRTSITK